MGCDIHAHVEYFEKSVDRPIVICFSKNMYMGRNYMLFNLLAGVRGFGGPVFPVRGLPVSPPVSPCVQSNYCLWVVDDDKKDMYQNFEMRSISKSEADKLVMEGKSKFFHKNYIIDPAAHTPSHLTKSELIEVRRRYLIDMIEFESTEYTGKKRDYALKTLREANEYEIMKNVFPSLESINLNAVIATMIAIENSGDYSSRFVFWFDS